MRADRVRSGKKRLHIFRTRVGRDVVILWCQTAHHVTHATTCEVRNVSTVTQSLLDLARGLLHWRKVHTVTVAVSLSETQFRQPAYYPALLCSRNERMINRTTAIEMQESATLNAGQASAYRTCRLNRRKSITCL